MVLTCEVAQVADEIDYADLGMYDDFDSTYIRAVFPASFQVEDEEITDCKAQYEEENALFGDLEAPPSVETFILGVISDVGVSMPVVGVVAGAMESKNIVIPVEMITQFFGMRHATTVCANPCASLQTLRSLMRFDVGTSPCSRAPPPVQVACCNAGYDAEGLQRGEARLAISSVGNFCYGSGAVARWRAPQIMQEADDFANVELQDTQLNLYFLYANINRVAGKQFVRQAAEYASAIKNFLGANNVSVPGEKGFVKLLDTQAFNKVGWGRYDSKVAETREALLSGMMLHYGIIKNANASDYPGIIAELKEFRGPKGSLQSVVSKQKDPDLIGTWDATLAKQYMYARILMAVCGAAKINKKQVVFVGAGLAHANMVDDLFGKGVDVLRVDLLPSPPHEGKDFFSQDDVPPDLFQRPMLSDVHLGKASSEGNPNVRLFSYHQQMRGKAMIAKLGLAGLTKHAPVFMHHRYRYLWFPGGRPHGGEIAILQVRTPDTAPDIEHDPEVFRGFVLRAMRRTLQASCQRNLMEVTGVAKKYSLVPFPHGGSPTSAEGMYNVVRFGNLGNLNFKNSTKYFDFDQISDMRRHFKAKRVRDEAEDSSDEDTENGQWHVDEKPSEPKEDRKACNVGNCAHEGNKHVGRGRGRGECKKKK